MFVEEEVNLFLISLMGATIQDSGSRERKNDWLQTVIWLIEHNEKFLKNNII